LPESPTLDPRVLDAIATAHDGDVFGAVDLADSAIADAPLDPSAHFVRGLILLNSGEPGDAIDSFRRALYADHRFGLAAFMLGRAHDVLGANHYALRAYEQALRTAKPDDKRYDDLLAMVDIDDVAQASRTRLASLR
jgi:tetratricopeptide (TPR) repeat protein